MSVIKEALKERINNQSVFYLGGMQEDASKDLFNDILDFIDQSSGSLNFPQLPPEYADQNDAVNNGGLGAGDIYHTGGYLRIVTPAIVPPPPPPPGGGGL